MKIVIETDKCRYSADVPSKNGEEWKKQLDEIYHNAFAYVMARDIDSDERNESEVK